LAGILLKLGAYGFLRFSLPMLAKATALAMPYLLWLSVAGIIYGALVALAQSDMKRLIAYSSVSHLGYCTLGLFALNRLGIQGGALQLVNHGLSTGGLFACVGMIYERYHTREIRQLGGLARSMPVLAFFMLVFTFSSIGLPGLNGFVGEMLLLVGVFQRGWVTPPPDLEIQLRLISVLALSGVVLGAWYMLWLVERTFFGPPKAPAGEHHEASGDISLREVAALAPLAAMIVWIGVTPRFFLDRMSPTLDEITAVVDHAYRTERELATQSPAGPAIAAKLEEAGQR
jgi:NADH-quinone oxidoreductase subunit M